MACVSLLGVPWWLNGKESACNAFSVWKFYPLENGMLKSPTIELLSMSPFMAVTICFMYWGAPTLGAWIFTIVFFLDWALDGYAVFFLVSYNSL